MSFWLFVVGETLNNRKFLLKSLLENETDWLNSALSESHLSFSFSGRNFLLRAKPLLVEVEKIFLFSGLKGFFFFSLLPRRKEERKEGFFFLLLRLCVFSFLDGLGLLASDRYFEIKI